MVFINYCSSILVITAVNPKRGIDIGQNTPDKNPILAHPVILMNAVRGECFGFIEIASVTSPTTLTPIPTYVANTAIRAAISKYCSSSLSFSLAMLVIVFKYLYTIYKVLQQYHVLVEHHI